MSALALTWMAGLVLARVRRERTQAQRARERASVLEAFLEIIGGAGDAAAQLRPYQRRARLLAEALLETLALVRGPDRDRLLEALRGLSIDDRLQARLFTHDREGRIAAAEALGAFPSERAAAALGRVWREARDPALRRAALQSLVEMDGAPPFAEVVAGLDDQGMESLGFVPILTRLARSDLQPALAALDDPELTANTRAIVVDVLGRTGDYAALSALSRAAVDEDFEIRAAAMRALGAIGHPAAEVALAWGLVDPRWEVRTAAAEATGRIGTTRLLPRLVKLLEDEVWWVRFRASNALARMGEAGVRSLEVAARAPSDLSRRAAALALAERVGT